MTPGLIDAIEEAIQLLRSGPNATEGWDDFTIGHDGLVATEPDEESLRPVHPEVKEHEGWIYVLSSDWGIEYVGLTRRALIRRLREHARSGSPLDQRQWAERRFVVRIDAYAVDDVARLPRLEWAFIHLLESPMNADQGRLA